MCIVLDEESLAVLALNPRRLKCILDTDDSYAVEMRRSNEDSTLLQAYCIIDMSREEVIKYAYRMKKLDIIDGIWYKYFEDNNVLGIPKTFQPQSRSLVMNGEQAEAAKQAAMSHFERHGNKYKAVGWMLLGAIVGIGSKTVIDKRAEAKNVGVGSGS